MTKNRLVATESSKEMKVKVVKWCQHKLNGPVLDMTRSVVPLAMFYFCLFVCPPPNMCDKLMFTLTCDLFNFFLLFVLSPICVIN